MVSVPRPMLVFPLLLSCFTSLSLADTIRPERQVIKRQIPEKVLIGYASNCDDKVKVAIRQGANVVIWAFMNLKPPENENQTLSKTTTQWFWGSLDFTCIRNLIFDMDKEGYDDTVHLVSFGGWNGPHFNSYFETAEDWFSAWKTVAGETFHGFDWNFEGNDDLSSSLNYFPKKTMDMIGGISKLAKKDSYIVTIVPAQSYLDIHSPKFSQYVNLTDKDRDWHSDFHYFGQNAYAYLLAEYGDYIDLVLVQFYESYSRAAMEIFHHHIAPEAYLSFYVQGLFNNHQQFYVDFEQDPDIGLKSKNVDLPLSKLVWGFSNGWALSIQDQQRHIFFQPECVQAAYQDLVDWMMEPRGFMFWNIDSEGDNGIFYSKELNNILHIRSSTNNEVSSTLV